MLLNRRQGRQRRCGSAARRRSVFECAWVALVVLSGTSAIACGSDENGTEALSGEERAVASVVVEYFDAVRRGDGEALCERAFMNETDADGDTHPRIETPEVCRQAEIGAHPDAPRPFVERVEVSGRTARAHLSFEDTEPGTARAGVVDLRRFAEHWRVEFEPR